MRDATMPSAGATLRQAVVSGSLASLLSAGVLVAAGRRECHSASAPVNAVSHWYWDREALLRQSPDLAHTATGYAIHHAAAVFWAGLYASSARRRPALRTPAGIWLGSLATAALACLVDMRLTPRRFTPGFEHRLSHGALTGVYAAFALGLAGGALALRARRQARARPAPAPARPARIRAIHTPAEDGR